MNILIFGAAGKMGQLLTQEALSRGHKVTAVVRDPAKFKTSLPNLKVVPGDATDLANIAKIAPGNEVAISAIGPSGGPEGDPSVLIQAAKALPDGLKAAGVPRLLIVGGAASLEVSPGKLLLDTPDFPKEWKGVATAARDALNEYRKADIDWVYFSPAAFFSPGKRTGNFRLGKDQLLTDAHGQSKLSYEDMAIAILDEAEHPQHHRERITVAY